MIAFRCIVLKVEFNRKYRLHQFSGGQIVNKSDYIKLKHIFLFSRISIETKSDEETKDVIIQLSQRDSRSLLMDNKETLIIGFTVLKVEFNRKYRLHQFSEEQIVIKSDYIKSKVGH